MGTNRRSNRINMKKLMTIVLWFVALGAFGQTQSNLPAGSTTYGNTYFLDTDGNVWIGTAAKKYRNVGLKSYVDSLNDLGWSNTQVDSAITAKINSAPSFANGITGPLGINTSTPAASLHIANGNAIILDRYKQGSFDVAANTLLRTYGGTISSPTAVLNNEPIGIFGAIGYNGVTDVGSTGLWKFMADGDQSAGNRGTRAELQINKKNVGESPRTLIDAREEYLLLSPAYEFASSAKVSIGAVGLGDYSTDNHKFEVVSTETRPTVSFGNVGNTLGNAGLHGWKARGTISEPSAVLSGDALFSFGFRGWGTTGLMPSAASMTIYATENFTDEDHGTRILFQTNSTGHSAFLGRDHSFQMRESGVFEAPKLSITDIDGAGSGLSLYGPYTGGQPTYGIFSGLTSSFGTHGAVSGSFATYFTTSVGFTDRGWIFKSATGTSGNAGSINANGVATFSQFRVSSLNTAPASSTATGTTGEIRVTATHIYVCTATNTWVRAALTTW